MITKKNIKIGKYSLEISNLNKVLFPRSGITKGEVISYYKDVSVQALPFFKNRPLTMVRCPDGIQAQQFFQKKIPSYFPPWIDRCEVLGKEGTIRQVIVNKGATLIYLANQACITFHLTLSQIDKNQFPGYIIFDIDPSIEDITLLKRVVWYIKELIDSLGLKAFIQTTGSRGFHIYIPIKRDSNFNQTHQFAKDLAYYLAMKHPDEITIEQSKLKRGNHVLIDYARNSYGLTAVAPYSIRVKETAPVATPVHWEELNNQALGPQTYTIKNILKRINIIDNPWANFSKHKLSLKPFHEKLVQLIKM